MKRHSASVRNVIKKIAKSAAVIVWTCGVVMLVQFLLSLLLSWLFSITPFHISSAAAQTIFSLLSYILSALIIFGLPQLLIKSLGKKHPNIRTLNFRVKKTDLGLNELPTWTDIGLAPIGLIVYAILASIFTTLFSAFPWFNVSEAQDVGFNTFILTSDRIFAFITLVIIAPIAEELIFRGYLYQKIKSFFYQKPSVPEKNLAEKTTSTRKIKARHKPEIIAIAIATLLTSLAFGLMHGQWNVGINVFAMSIVLCLMREITGSIYSGILMHMIKNLLAFYLLYIANIGF